MGREVVPPEAVGNPRVGDSTIPNERKHRWGTFEATLAVINESGRGLQAQALETHGRVGRVIATAASWRI
jgi:hypothetical protein